MVKCVKETDRAERITCKRKTNTHKLNCLTEALLEFSQKNILGTRNIRIDMVRGQGE